MKQAGCLGRLLGAIEIVPPHQIKPLALIADSLSHIPVGPAGERPTNSQVGGEIDWKYSLKIELFFFFLTQSLQHWEVVISSTWRKIKNRL